MGIDRNANAGTHVEGQILDDEGFVQGFRDPHDGGDSVVNVTDGGQEHRELVTVQSRHGVGLPQGILQPGPDLLQEGVARQMAEGVVDLFEAVEVHDQERNVGALSLCGAEGLPQAIIEGTPYNTHDSSR